MGKNISYILGLDVGIASLGWSVVAKEGEELSRIVKAGVRTFTKAEHPKGDSLALPRRLARGARRTTRRRAYRLSRIKKLLIQERILSVEEMNTLFNTHKKMRDPWQLRSEGLDRILTNQEFSRVLIHVGKRRGFRSMRKTESEDKETGKLLLGIRANRDLLDSKHYRSTGEMFYKDSKFVDHKRNKAEEYSHTVSRELLIDEINILFTKQRLFGNSYATEKLQSAYLTIFLSQRPIGDIYHMVGCCTFDSNEKRAAKYSFTSERFILLSKINNFSYAEKFGNKIPLNTDEKQLVIGLAYNQVKISYKQLRKLLNLGDLHHFTGLNYFLADKKQKDAESEIFIELKGYHALRKAISRDLGNQTWREIAPNKKLLDEIATALTYFKSDDSISDALKHIEPAIIDAVLGVSFSKVVSLSLKTMQKLIPHMEEGLRYDEACKEEGLQHYKPVNKSKHSLLPVIPYQDIRNPVVFRALTQTRKVVNEIIRRYGMPKQINIELARDLARPFQERRAIEKGQKAFRDNKEEAYRHFIELYKTQPTGADLLRFRLHKEQNGACPYSGEYIEPSRLLEGGYAEIDHILPHSRSFDDSINNKVLTFASENQQKRNQTPYEYLDGKNDSLRWRMLITNAARFKDAKKRRLLKIDYDPSAENAFKERNLSDTRYIARFILNYIKQNLEFDIDDDKERVQVRAGALTGFLRQKWGILKVRSDNDLHHALDATVVACATQAMVKKVSEYSRRKEMRETTSNAKKKNDTFPVPWFSFREDLLNALEAVFVSRKPNRKITGQAHKDTIRSSKCLVENISVVKTPINKVTLHELDNLYDLTYNKAIYNTLKQRLNEYNGDHQRAFNKPIYMPTKSGKPGPVIRSVKLKRVTNNGVLVRNGISDNGAMIRTDLFTKGNKYYLVPIYVADRLKNELPNHAIFQGKTLDQWPLIDESYTFCHSLFKDDLIELQTKKGEKLIGYYKGCHSRTGNINIEAHDRSWKREGVGIKNATVFRKLEASLLGEISFVKQETRHGLAKPSNNTTSKTQS